MSPLVAEVNRLENKYQRNGKTSFLFVPDDECKKFAVIRDELERKHANKQSNHWAKYSRSKEYRQAMNEFLSKTQTSIYTIEELTEMIDRDPVLSDHGRHMHETNAVYALLNQHGLKWRKRHASDYYTK